jgi:hypothetical protein
MEGINNILEQFEMDIMEDLEEATPVELNIEDVETRRNLNKRIIEAIEEVNKEVMEEKIIKTIRMTSLAKDFIQQTEKSLKVEVKT